MKSEPDWSLLPAATPAHVRAMVERCCKRTSRERLRDIGEARISTRGSHGRGGESRRAGAAAAGIPLVAGGGSGIRGGGPGRVRDPPVRAGYPAGPVRKFDLVAKDMVVDWPIAPRLSPDGSRFAYASANQVWVRDLDRLEPRAVADISAARPVSWSPDSRELVFS